MINVTYTEGSWDFPYYDTLNNLELVMLALMWMWITNWDWNMGREKEQGLGVRKGVNVCGFEGGLGVGGWG